MGARLRKFFGNSNVVYKFYKDKEDNTLKDNKRHLQVSVYTAMAASEFNKNVPARDKIHFVDGVILELLPEAIKLLNKGSDSPLNIMMAKSLFWYVEREVEGPGKFETIVCNTGYIKKVGWLYSLLNTFLFILYFHNNTLGQRLQIVQLRRLSNSVFEHLRFHILFFSSPNSRLF